MEITNVKLINADNTLGEVAQQKVNGALAFKLYRLKQQLEQLVVPIRQTLEDIGYEDQQAQEFQEVLQITQEFIWVYREKDVFQQALLSIPQDLKEL